MQNVRDGLLLSLVLRYEQDCDQFLILSKQTLDSSSARLAIAGLRNEGLVEEQVRGVIRLTALGYKKYKNAPLPYAYAGCSDVVPEGAKHGRSISTLGSYTCLSNLA
jgi:hypothetical protein